MDVRRPFLTASVLYRTAIMSAEYGEEFVAQFVDQKCFDALLKIIENYSHSVCMRIAVLRVLVNISTDNEKVKEMIISKEDFVKILREDWLQSRNPEIISLVCLLFKNLCSSEYPDAIVTITENGDMVADVVSLLPSFMHCENTVSSMCGFLWSASRIRTVRRVAYAQKGMLTTVTSILRQAESEQLKQQAVGFLLVISAEWSDKISKVRGLTKISFLLIN